MNGAMGYANPTLDNTGLKISCGLSWHLWGNVRIGGRSLGGRPQLSWWQTREESRPSALSSWREGWLTAGARQPTSVRQPFPEERKCQMLSHFERRPFPTITGEISLFALIPLFLFVEYPGREKTHKKKQTAAGPEQPSTGGTQQGKSCYAMPGHKAVIAVS